MNRPFFWKCPWPILLAINLLPLLLSGQLQWSAHGGLQQSYTAQDLLPFGSDTLYYLANGDSTALLGKQWRLICLNPQGQPLWEKKYGNLGNDEAEAMDHFGDSLWVAGWRKRNDSLRAILTLLDRQGNVLLEKTTGRGDTSLQWVDLEVDTAGSIFLLGRFRAQSGAAMGACLARISRTGQLDWIRYSRESAEIIPQALCLVPPNRMAFTSDFQTPTRFDVQVQLWDAQGNFLRKQIVSNGYTRGGNAIDFEAPNTLVLGGEGASALSVNFDITLSMLDTNLQTLRDIFVRPGVPKNDAAFAMLVRRPGEYLFTGYQINPETDHTEMVVLIADSLGNTLYNTRYCPSASCIGAAVAVRGNYLWAAGSDFNSLPSLLLAQGTLSGLESTSPHSPTVLRLFPNPSIGGQFNLPDRAPRRGWAAMDAQGRPYAVMVEGSRLSIAGAKAGKYWLYHPDFGAPFSVLIAP